MDPDQSKKEWLVIVNPSAGNGRGGRDWPRIAALLKAEGLKFTERFTESKGHATLLAEEGIAAGFRKIIATGGDGTLNEVVNGVLRNSICPAGSIHVGIIPVGTGNDWGRMFGIPHNYETAVRIIRAEKKLLHDVGLVKYHEGSLMKERYFINIAGIGFESVVVKRTNHQKERGWGGRLIYFYNLLVTLFSFKNTPVVITVDSQTKKASIFSINIGNGRYCGGGMRQTPNALPDDGLLDVTVINSIGKFEIIRNLGILYNGKILDHPKIDGYRCKYFRVDSAQVIYAEADGETLGHTPAEFTIIPSGITMIYGTRIIQ